MFVPVCEGEGQGRAIVRKPAVFTLTLLVHEADPVIHATVGPVLTQQTVDKCLLKPASMRKMRIWLNGFHKLNKCFLDHIKSVGQ